MAKGFGGMPGNMGEIMKQAQKMQEKLLQAQQDTEKLSAEESSGGGMVKVVMNGKYQITALSIDKEVVNPDDIEMLQDLIKAAVNGATVKVGETIKNEMSKVTGGMNIPGMF
jgi:DNA-binding YbaB/EbfC family protein